MGKCVRFGLPCGKVVSVPECFADLLVLFGCHGYCPKGRGYMESGECETFRVLYEKWLASGVEGERSGWYDWHC